MLEDVFTQFSPIYLLMRGDPVGLEQALFSLYIHTRTRIFTLKMKIRGATSKYIDLKQQLLPRS